LQWENEEEELEDFPQEPQGEEDHLPQEEPQHNQLQQPQMSKLWAKIPHSLTGIEAKQTPS